MQRFLTHDAKTRDVFAVLMFVPRLGGGGSARKPRSGSRMHACDVVQPAAEQSRRLNCAAHSVNDMCVWIDECESLPNCIRLRAVEISFGDDNAVRDRGLAPGLFVLF